MPPWPIAMPSSTAIVLNSRGDAAGRVDGVGDDLADRLQVRVAGDELGVGVGDRDDRLAEVLALDAGGAQQRAGAGHVAAVGDGAGPQLGHRARVARRASPRASWNHAGCHSAVPPSSPSPSSRPSPSRPPPTRDPASACRASARRAGSSPAARAGRRPLLRLGAHRRAGLRRHGRRAVEAHRRGEGGAERQRPAAVHGRLEPDGSQDPRPELRDGERWQRQGYTCRNRGGKLTCRRGAHGFALASDAQRYW